jgi:hypothetical protein
MATTLESTDRARWDATNAANKDNLLRVIRDEAERMLAYAEAPANWEGPTASGHWQVRDIVGHRTPRRRLPSSAGTARRLLAGTAAIVST